MHTQLYRIIQGSLTVLKIPCAPPSHKSLVTTDLYWLHSFVFSEMSYSQNHTICRLFKWFPPVGHMNLRFLRICSGEGHWQLLQYSCLENPMDGGAWWVTVHGVPKSLTQLSDFTFTFHFHALEKEMETHFSVLAWRIQGQRSLVGCRLWGHAESYMTDVTSQQQQQHICSVTVHFFLVLNKIPFSRHTIVYLSICLLSYKHLYIGFCVDIPRNVIAD